MHSSARLWSFLVFLVFLIGCSTPKPKKKDGPPKHIPHNLLKTPDATPRFEPFSKYGNRFGKGGRSNSYVALKKRYHVLPTSKGYRKRGLASWYGTQFHGRKTSNGEKYDMFAMTAAHTSLPLPTYAKVTNLENGKSVIVKINDRGPFHNNRLIDLSYVAAAKLGILGKGTGHVEVESIDPRDHRGMKRNEQINKSLQRSRLAKSVPSPASKLPLLPPQKKAIYLQIGTFQSRQKAQGIIDKLPRTSVAKIVTQKNKNTLSFAVKIGPVHNEDEAIRLTQKFAKAKLPPAVVIQEHP